MLLFIDKIIHTNEFHRLPKKSLMVSRKNLNSKFDSLVKF